MSDRLAEFERMLDAENVCNVCLDSLASIERFANAHGYTLDEWCDLMRRHNRRVEDEWLADYAKRLGRPVDEVRDEVYEYRMNIQRHMRDAGFDRNGDGIRHYESRRAS